MARGGTNADWAYQLTSREGHSSNSGKGLRYLDNIRRGHRNPDPVTKEKKRQRKLVKVLGLNMADLQALFAKGGSK